ncbi:HST3 protein [Mycena chlorophos]|uniref:HST3 protein n=1 Tax=Mycena chlorophos TaxID=658473 RepID=A0A8H6TC30_MYCCL|nr:HST3 protein [Mycena chlorophos]
MTRTLRLADAATDSLDSTQRVLNDLSLSVAKCKKIIVVTGAGISSSSVDSVARTFALLTACTPLVKEKYPEVVLQGRDLFDVSLFRDPTSTAVFHTFIAQLKRSIDAAEPSPTHRFLHTLDAKKKLLRSYTQNIDGFEARVGYRTARLCSAEYPYTAEHLAIFLKGDAPECPECLERDNPVKGSKKAHVGKVIFVNRTPPPSSEWSQIIDYHVQGTTDDWVGQVIKEWKFQRPEDWEKTATLLQIGHHLLEGRVTQLAKPLAGLRRALKISADHRRGANLVAVSSTKTIEYSPPQPLSPINRHLRPLRRRRARSYRVPTPLFNVSTACRLLVWPARSAPEPCLCMTLRLYRRYGSAPISPMAQTTSSCLSYLAHTSARHAQGRPTFHPFSVVQIGFPSPFGSNEYTSSCRTLTGVEALWAASPISLDGRMRGLVGWLFGLAG